MSMLKGTLVAVTAMSLIGIMLWPTAVFMSIFMFDAEGSSENWITVALFYSLFWYPVPAIIGSVIFGVADKKAHKVGCIVGALVSASGYISIVCFSFALDIFCDGYFACQ